MTKPRNLFDLFDSNRKERRLLLFWRAQLLQFQRDVGSVGSGLHLLVDVDDFSFVIDVVSPSTGKTAGTKATECFGDFLVGVTQDRVVEVKTFRKVSVLFDGVAAGGEVCDFEFL